MPYFDTISSCIIHACKCACILKNTIIVQISWFHTFATIVYKIEVTVKTLKVEKLVTKSFTI